MSDIETVYVNIDSKYRDRSRFPNASYFQFEMDTALKNVSQIELVYALFPNQQVKNTRYYNLFIKELDDGIITNTPHSPFTQIPLVNLSSMFVEHVIAKFRSVYVFNPKLQKMSKLTIYILDEDGNVPEIEGDFLLRFEITKDCYNMYSNMSTHSGT